MQYMYYLSTDVLFSEVNLWRTTKKNIDLFKVYLRTIIDQVSQQSTINAVKVINTVDNTAIIADIITIILSTVSKVGIIDNCYLLSNGCCFFSMYNRYWYNKRCYIFITSFS